MFSLITRFLGAINGKFINYNLSLITKLGGLAQLARASALHAEGHRFDSDILHKKM